MGSDYTVDTLAKIDREIREGRLVSARAELERLSQKGRLGKLSTAKLANLFWRVGFPSRGLRLIRSRIPVEASRVWSRFPDEGAEYAVCLAKLGAFEEAKYQLALPEIASSLQGPLYQGFALVETWDYAGAIAPFQRYVKQSRLSEYAKQVGLANLACALIYESQLAAGRAILRRLLHDSSLANRVFLLGFVLECSAIERVSSGDYLMARRFLDDAELRWSHVKGLDRFFLSKWRAVLDLKEHPGVKTRQNLEAIRMRARELRNWETVRDCDRHEALAMKNAELFRRLYYGTPYPAFREKLVRDFGPARLPSSFLWKVGDGASKGKLSALVDEKERARRKLKGQSLALVSLLASDFYRPQKLATLFGRLFPEERFNPASSPKRIYEGIRRLEKWFREEKLPLHVEEIDSGYRLQSREPYAIELPAPERTNSGWSPLVQRLKHHFGERLFSIGEAESALAMPRRTLLRQLQWLESAKDIHKTGNGRATRYRVA